ncbi:MAG TPA: hypothetical protein VM846_11950 [Vicinamibacterales bacterium]|nr:hypothetical protein [Vicinamibacterales bacterium]
MSGISIGRSIAVVVAALLLLGFIDQTLERTLVMTLAQAPVQDAAAYLTIRNRPAVLAFTVVTHALASLLTGYVLAKLAGSHEVQHAMVTAALAVMLIGFASLTPNIMLPPLWVRAAMVLITPPALIAGAYVRGQARLIRMEREQS